MRAFTRLALAFLLVSFSAMAEHSFRIPPVDMAKFEKALTTTGAEAYIHGSAPEYGEFVLSIGHPLRAVYASLVPKNKAVREELAKLHHDDKVLVKGEFLDNPSAQKHILVTEVKLLEAFDPGLKAEPFVHQTKLPDELKGKSEFVGIIHAVVAGGKVLVVEYKDAVIPVFVKDSTAAQGLFRGDKIRLHFTFQAHPHAPVHLNLDSKVAHPIEVLDSIASHNGEKVTLEGELALFPKSPRISLDVFALRETDADGVTRNYTLVNFEDPDVWQGLLEKLHAAWDRHPQTVANARNVYVNRAVRIRVTGNVNMVDPTQANPQLLVGSVSDIEVTEK